MHVDRTLPYELRALEGALHNAVGRLELEVLSLEDRINTGLRQLDVRVGGACSPSAGNMEFPSFVPMSRICSIVKCSSLLEDCSKRMPASARYTSGQRYRLCCAGPWCGEAWVLWRSFDVLCCWTSGGLAGWLLLTAYAGDASITLSASCWGSPGRGPHESGMSQSLTASLVRSITGLLDKVDRDRPLAGCSTCITMPGGCCDQLAAILLSHSLLIGMEGNAALCTRP